MDEPECQTPIPEPVELGLARHAYVDSTQERPLEIQCETASSEQKFAESTSRELPQQQQQRQQQLLQEQQVSVENDDEISEARNLPEISQHFELFQADELPELWGRVLKEITPRSLKHLLQKQCQLLAAGVAVDGSVAVVELEFEDLRDKQEAERSWRSICIAFQKVHETAVELRISCRHQQDAFSAASTEEPTTQPCTNGEVLTDEDFYMQLGPSTSQLEHKELVIQEDAYLKNMQEAPRRPRSRRDSKPPKHRKAAENLESDRRGNSGAITPRRLPPSRRRKPKRAEESASPKRTKAAIPVRKTRRASQELSSLSGGEFWESDRSGSSGDKESPTIMMEEPLGETDETLSARKTHSEQQFQNEGSMPAAALDGRTSTIDAQRGIPREIRLCWNNPSPESDVSMRKTRVKSLRMARVKALFLRFVPWSAVQNSK